MKKCVTGMLMAVLAVGALGCEGGVQNGAAIGGVVGATAGGVIGSYSYARAGEGALIGGVAGAAAGALIGRALEDQERADYQRYSKWKPEDYPAEYRSYRYHHTDLADCDR